MGGSRRECLVWGSDAGGRQLALLSVSLSTRRNGSPIFSQSDGIGGWKQSDRTCLITQHALAAVVTQRRTAPQWNLARGHATPPEVMVDGSNIALDSCQSGGARTQ